jgi:hypothetical protein
VIEFRIEADIRASRHAATAVVPELFRLTTWHPERERLWLLLMLAFFRSGRQAEALSAFGQARQAITADYGLDPGPELHGMHKRVYAQDPTLLSEPLDRLCFTCRPPVGCLRMRPWRAAVVLARLERPRSSLSHKQNAMRYPSDDGTWADAPAMRPRCRSRAKSQKPTNSGKGRA